jgi:esterase/lipase superfamily enzyme
VLPPPPRPPSAGVFFSYHADDDNDRYISGEFAGVFKELLKHRGHLVEISFQPHRDDAIGLDERARIIQYRIATSDVFVPFVSHRYLESEVLDRDLDYFQIASRMGRRPIEVQVLLDADVPSVFPHLVAFRLADQSGRFSPGSSSFLSALRAFSDRVVYDLETNGPSVTFPRKAPLSPRPYSPQGNGYRYQVWYATNRELQRQTDGDVISYSNAPDSRGVVSYGACLVDIPKTHNFGSIGKPWWKRWLRLGGSDDRLRLHRITTFHNKKQYFYEMNSELDELDPESRQVLIYLHGYNVTFEQAALRAAQIGFDLKIKGVTAFFSWPSCGTIFGYLADAERIGASESVIADFLAALPAYLGSIDVHILAHSMGNRGLARAFQRILAKAELARRVQFAHIVLAAPDIEVSLFRDLATAYPQVSRRTTMYISARDRALGMSKWLQDAARAGFTPPVTVVPGVDTVEVSNVDLTLLGHGYYAEADGVLRDIYELIRFGATPDERARTRPVDGPMGRYWVIGK